MSRARIKQIVRQFQENGLKLLLENPHNARDLLLLTGIDLVELIDFDHLTREATTFVGRDYRHLEADVVLVAPLRHRDDSRPRQVILIYILIEHQSEPDRWMPLRMLEYVLQIYKYQLRRWSRQHRSLRGLRLQPVLPVVFYTGTRRWSTVGRLVDLLALGERFKRVAPSLEPLFINLPAMPPNRLESAGGFFGWVLRLVQQRRARPEEFRALLHDVVRHLEAMPAEERLRWLELLSYIQALVYHERDESERPSLQATIEASVRTDSATREVTNMLRSGAEVLKAEGRKEGRKEGEVHALQRTLLKQLRLRFGDVSPEVIRTIKRTRDVKRLDAWLARTVTAATLAEMRIGPVGS